MSRARPRVWTLVTTGALAVAAFVPSWPDASADITTAFVHFNMCGAAQNTGCASGGSTLPAEEVVSVVEDTDATWVTLNESCRSQFDHVMTQLGSAYDGVFSTTRTSVPNCGNGDFGNAVIWAADLQASREPYEVAYAAQDAGPEVRKLLCQAVGSPPYRLCVTHLDPTADPRDAQAQQLGAEMTDQLASLRPALLGGDINDTPASATLNALYAPACPGPPVGSGSMFEASVLPCRRGGDPTRGDRKIDYEFFHPIRFIATGGRTVDAQHSDHHMLITNLVDVATGTD